LGVTVVFGNDEVQQIDLHRRLDAGERTQPIDLEGRGRPIKRFEIAARAGHDFHRHGILIVYAEQVHERDDDRGRSDWRGGRADWELLGQQNIGFGADRDVVRVGRQEGRFSAIRLRVDRADVFLISLRVVYERGQVDDYQVNTRMRAGTETQPLDLRGERRSIR
jgi:hypothetical protein